MIKRIIVILIGILMIGLGTFVLINSNGNKKKYTTEVTGVIISVKKKVNDNRQVKYYPVIRYKANNKEIKKQCRTGSVNQFEYKKGDKITILYSSSNEEDFILKTNKSSISIIIFGSLFIIIGLIILIYGITCKDKLLTISEILAYFASIFSL